MKVDITAWCDKEILAAQHLEIILNEDENSKYINSVGTCLTRFNRKFKSLQDIKDISTRKFYMQLTFNLIKEGVGKHEYPKNIKSHLLNVITALYRRNLKAI